MSWAIINEHEALQISKREIQRPLFKGNWSALRHTYLNLSIIFSNNEKHTNIMKCVRHIHY